MFVRATATSDVAATECRYLASEWDARRRRKLRARRPKCQAPVHTKLLTCNCNRHLPCSSRLPLLSQLDLELELKFELSLVIFFLLPTVN